MLSNGPEAFSVYKVIAPIVIALTVLGASLYHFGAANPMYTRKNEALSATKPARIALVFGGVIAMLAAMKITSHYLNSMCQLIVVIDAVIIIAYAGILSRYWLSKNLLMTFVCVSPVLLGWFAGERLHPDVPYGIALTFFAYLAREITKDIQDIKANHGHRITLPIWLGIIPARRITAVVIAIALAILAVFGARLLAYDWYVLLPYCGVWYFWFKATASLFSNAGQTGAKESQQILLGSACLMINFLLLIYQ
jgi:4-hydroxybenzoate polyprenyltransferase